MAWAKAPDFRDQPERIEAVRAQTLVDKQTYLDLGMQSVECRTCGTRVLARKNSYKQTSIQWTSDPADTCPVFKEAISAGGSTAQHDSCPRLRDSIDHAVAEGLLEVIDREGA